MLPVFTRCNTYRVTCYATERAEDESRVMCYGVMPKEFARGAAIFLKRRYAAERAQGAAVDP